MDLLTCTGLVRDGVGQGFETFRPFIGLDTPGRFSISYKGNNFCDFLFAYLHSNTLLKRGLLQKGRICSPHPLGANCFLLEETSFQKGGKAILAILSGCRMHGRLVIRRLRVRFSPGLAALSWRLMMKYFYGHSLLSTDSRRAVVSFLQKMSTTRDEQLRGVSLPRKV